MNCQQDNVVTPFEDVKTLTPQCLSAHKQNQDSCLKQGAKSGDRHTPLLAFWIAFLILLSHYDSLNECPL